MICLMYIINNIATLKSYAGKRINSITIEQHNFLTSIDSRESNLKDVFFKDLNLRKPDVYFGGENSSLGEFLAKLFYNFTSKLY